MFNKALVIRGGAIGDFILTLPALAALRGQFTSLEILGYPRIARLAVASGLADEVRAMESPFLSPFFVRDGALRKPEMAYFSQFELIISYAYDPEGILQANIKRCSPAKYIVGPHRPNESLALHASEVFLQPVRDLGIPALSAEPKLEIAGRAEGLPDGKRWLAVHPGSGSPRKNWPTEHWVRLFETLQQNTSSQFLIIGGEAESDRLPGIIASLDPKRYHLAHNLPLVDLAQRLACCEAFIGHDSGISHLAAALGLPGLVLWGETVVDIWRPRSQRFTILKHPQGLQKLPVEQVIRSLAADPSIAPALS